MSIRKFRAHGALLLSVLFASCAIVPGPRGAGSGDVVVGSTLAMVTVAPTDGATDPVALEAVRRVLTGQGYRVAAGGEFIADVGFALRDRTIGFSSTASENGQWAHTNSPPRKGDALSLCHSRVGRMTISILDQSSRKLIFRGVAEDMFCGRLDESKLFLLASVALRDIRTSVATR